MIEDDGKNRLSEYDRFLIGARGTMATEHDLSVLALCALGMTEEADELTDAIANARIETRLVAAESRQKVLSEAGDCLWYAFTAAHRIDATAEMIDQARHAHQHHAMPWQPPSKSASFELSLRKDGPARWALRDHSESLYRASARLCGVVKKAAYHGVPLDRERVFAMILDYYCAVIDTLSLVGCSVEGACSANVAKIRKRFPSGGFSPEEARARADEGGK